MYRPPYFLEKHWHPVETTREKADVAFAEWSKRHPDASEAARDQARIDLVIKPVFFEFANALCNAARRGLIPIEEFQTKFQNELDNFRLYLSAQLRPLANAGFAHVGPDKAFSRAAHEAIIDSPEWDAHLRKRAAVRAQLLALEPAAPAPADNDPPSTAHAIDQYRQDCGWTFEDLAEKMQLNRSTVVNHATGATKPRPQNLRRYAKKFSEALGQQVTVADLRRGKVVQS